MHLIIGGIMGVIIFFAAIGAAAGASASPGFILLIFLAIGIAMVGAGYSNRN